MIDPRVYRAAFLPAVVALVVLMFSVEPIPEPVRTGTSAAGFDEGRAAATARQFLEATPDRAPGSQGDRAAADLVEERFAAIPSGEVSEQRFSESFDGEDVELRNVILTLPGTSERAVVVIAPRDSAHPVGAASSAAATGTLIEIAADFGESRHQRTLLFVSTDGSSDGATGVREFVDAYPSLDLIDAAIVISQPGAPDPHRPHVVSTSVAADSTSSQLVQSAKAALEAETERGAGLPGFFGGLFRLALPSGLGEQAVLIDEGVDAVAISAAGERALDPSEDDLDSLTTASIGEFGRTTYSLLLALDGTSGPLAHGPADHLTLAGNLIPGWALGLLALTLILPAVIASIDAIARASRRNEAVGAAFLWTSARALAFAAPLAFAYLLAVLGIASDPHFPFDPGRFGFGWRAAGVLLALVASFAIAVALLRPLAIPVRPDIQTLAAALGVVASLATLGIWLVNPYLALLATPLAHVWVIGERPGAPSLAGTILTLVVSLVPLTAALIYVADRLELGLETPWHLLLLVTGGQVTVVQSLLLCLLAGSALGLLAIGGSTRSHLGLGATPHAR